MILSPQLQKLFDALIVVNSMAFKDEDPGGEKMVSVGSEAETALLSFAKELQWMDFGEGQNATEVIQMIPCSSEQKVMGVVVKVESGYKRRE